MLEIIALLCLIAALVVLFILSKIDLEVGLLPNELVLGFFTLGLVFHLCTLFAFLPIKDMALGGFIGGGLLYLIRTIATMLYQEDALGLGDVKLLAAGGVWLGPYYILIALSLGAIAGLFYGISVALYEWNRTKAFPNLNTLSLPAGPGFAAGIVMTAVVKFWDFPAMLISLIS